MLVGRFETWICLAISVAWLTGPVAADSPSTTLRVEQDTTSSKVENPADGGSRQFDVSEAYIMVNIFHTHGIVCHGKWKQEAELDLRTRDSILKGGKSGPALVPGKPDKSLVYRRIRNEIAC